MKIAVINEVSASLRNEDIVKALHKTTDAEILNVGMKTPEQMPSLTYIHTSYMAAILLNTGSCDFVVGGCGTGQGFLNGVLQFPGIVCGLIVEPLDGWLFSQINGGNCVSLPLNKGYGWAANVNLEYTDTVRYRSRDLESNCRNRQFYGSFGTWRRWCERCIRVLKTV